VSTIGAVLDERKVTRANRMQSLSILAKVMARRGQDGYWQYLDEARDSSIGLEEREWLIFVGLARIEAYWLEGRLDAARAELARIRDASAGLAVPYRRWLALWTRRLTGVAEPVDLEPFASYVAGDAAHAAELWDRLGYRYEAALALLDTKEETHLRESLAWLSNLGAEAAARLVRQTMRAGHPLHSRRYASSNQGPPTRADRTRAADPRAALSRPFQRGDLSKIVHLGENGGAPRIRNPRQTRRHHTQGCCQGGAQVGVDLCGPLIGIGSHETR